MSRDQSFFRLRLRLSLGLFQRNINQTKQPLVGQFPRGNYSLSFFYGREDLQYLEDDQLIYLNNSQ